MRPLCMVFAFVVIAGGCITSSEPSKLYPDGDVVCRMNITGPINQTVEFTRSMVGDIKEPNTISLVLNNPHNHSNIMMSIKKNHDNKYMIWEYSPFRFEYLGKSYLDKSHKGYIHPDIKSVENCIIKGAFEGVLYTPGSNPHGIYVSAVFSVPYPDSTL